MLAKLHTIGFLCFFLCLSSGQSFIDQVETQYVDFASSELAGLVCSPLKDFSSLRNGRLMHYPSTAAYNDFRGDDLAAHGKQRNPIVSSLVASKDGRPKTTICTGDDPKEGTWYLQRVGPFNSTGGNDWWQFEWFDVFGLEELGMLGPDETAVITGHWSGPVSAGDFEPIGLPPLHMHHIHVAEDEGLSADLSKCFLEGVRCIDAAFIYMHHGDGQGVNLPNSTTANLRTFGEDYGQGFAKRIHRPISITAEINDFRPDRSDGLEWWYQTAIRVVRGEAAKSKSMLSVHSLANPSDIGVFGQLTRFLTIRVHPNNDSVLFYTGRMPFEGDLHQVYAHSHMAASQQMYLFEGSPQDLGLEAVRPTNSWVPVNSFDALKAMGKTPHDEPSRGRNNKMVENMILDRVEKGSASIVCRAQANREEVDGKFYDRTSTLTCNPWLFKSGTQYTTVAFNGNPDLVLDPPIRDVAISVLTRPSSAAPNNTFPQHHFWYLTYRSVDKKSRYTWGQGSTNPDATSPVFSFVDMIRLFFWGTPQLTPQPFDFYVLIPVARIVVGVVTLLLHRKLSWFAPFPWSLLYEIAGLGGFLLGFPLLLTIVWSPVGFRWGRVPAVEVRTTAASVGRVLVSYFLVAIAMVSTLAAVIAVVSPSNVYLVNRYDQELLRQDPKYTNSGGSWAIGFLVWATIVFVTVCCVHHMLFDINQNHKQEHPDEELQPIIERSLVR